MGNRPLRVATLGRSVLASTVGVVSIVVVTVVALPLSSLLGASLARAVAPDDLPGPPVGLPGSELTVTLPGEHTSNENLAFDVRNGHGYYVISVQHEREESGSGLSLDCSDPERQIGTSALGPVLACDDFSVAGRRYVRPDDGWSVGLVSSGLTEEQELQVLQELRPATAEEILQRHG